VSISRTNVEVDGAIYLKADGTRLITAFRNEVNSEKEKWFYFRYTLENGMLIPVSIGGWSFETRLRDAATRLLSRSSG